MLEAALGKPAGGKRGRKAGAITRTQLAALSYDELATVIQMATELQDAVKTKAIEDAKAAVAKAREDAKKAVEAAEAKLKELTGGKGK